MLEAGGKHPQTQNCIGRNPTLETSWAIAGIAHPERFFAMLRDLGVVLAGTRALDSGRAERRERVSGSGEPVVRQADRRAATLQPAPPASCDPAGPTSGAPLIHEEPPMTRLLAHANRDMSSFLFFAGLVATTFLV